MWPEQLNYGRILFYFVMFRQMVFCLLDKLRTYVTRALFYHFPDFSMRLKSIEFTDLIASTMHIVHGMECLKHLRSTLFVVAPFLFRQIACAFEIVSIKEQIIHRNGKVM